MLIPEFLQSQDIIQSDVKRAKKLLRIMRGYKSKMV